MRYDALDCCQTSLTPQRFWVSHSYQKLVFWNAKNPQGCWLLQSWPTIGGYDRTFDTFFLSDCLDVQFGLEWGSVDNLCRMSGPKDKWQPTSLLAVMSFCNNVEMKIFRGLIPFLVSESLKALDPPIYSHLVGNGRVTSFGSQQLPPEFDNMRSWKGDRVSHILYTHNLENKFVTEPSGIKLKFSTRAKNWDYRT